MAKRRKGPFLGRYFLSRKQMVEAKAIQDQSNGRMKRGEIRNFTLVICGCGCGAFASSEKK